MRAGRQRGFTLIAGLLTVAAMGAGLAALATFASHALQREKEAELLFVGNQYREAIGAYFRKEQTYPTELAVLLQDRRYPMPVRHLRKLYRDPITGSADWALIKAPEGGIMGVHSKSEQVPIKSGNFLPRDRAFGEAKTYADWQFFHAIPGTLQGSPAGATPAR
jgi:type II secretory pathway pseudopilin PulG